MRTARHHRELDRRGRHQHKAPLSFSDQIRAIRRQGYEAFAGYHVCMCTACGDFRAHKARQSIKAIESELNRLRKEQNLW